MFRRSLEKVYTWFRNSTTQLEHFANTIDSGDPLFINLDELGLPEPKLNHNDYENQKLWARYLAKRVLTEEMKDAFDVVDTNMHKSPNKSYSQNYKGIQGVASWFGKLVAIMPNGTIIRVVENAKKPNNLASCIHLCVFTNEDLAILKEAIDYFKRLTLVIEQICNFYNANIDTAFIKDESVVNFLKEVITKIRKYNIDKAKASPMEEAEKVYNCWKLMVKDNFLKELEELENKLKSLKSENNSVQTNKEVEETRKTNEYKEWLRLKNEGDLDANAISKEQVIENLELGRSWNGN